MGIFIMLFVVPMFSFGGAETLNNSFKCIKVVKHAVKICQNLLLTVSSICGFMYKNMGGAHNGAQWILQ